MPKPKLTLDDFSSKAEQPATAAIPEHEYIIADLVARLAQVKALLRSLLQVTGEINANGVHATDRCYDCAKRATHNGSQTQCPCVCHEARWVLAELADQ